MTTATRRHRKWQKSDWFITAKQQHLFCIVARLQHEKSLFKHKTNDHFPFFLELSFCLRIQLQKKEQYLTN